MTPGDPIEQRARLQQEVRAATAVRSEAERHKSRLATEHKELLTRRSAAAAAAARGREHAESASEVDTLVTLNEAEAQRAALDYTGAYRGLEAARRELEQLYVDHLDAFVEEALAATETFQRAFAEIETPYRKAMALHGRADETWAPLIAAIRTRTTERHQATGLDLGPHALSRETRREPFPALSPGQAESVFKLVADGVLLPCPANLRPEKEIEYVT